MPPEHAQDPAAGERPATKPFALFLQETREGALHAELSERLAEITQAALTHGRKGSLTLSITVAPNKDGVTLTVSDDLKVKLPEGDRGAAVFWADEHGNLSRRNPRQPELPLQGLSGGQTTTPPREASA